jgi:VWFA-related protein
MKDKSLSRILILFFILVMFAFIGCSGDDESTSPPPPTPSPSIEVMPSSLNFGPVTPGNTLPPQQVEIKNIGTAILNVSNISLLDENSFSLDLSGGSNPCNSATPALTAGDNCTVEVTFQPPADNTFNTNLAIISNDTDNPAVNVQLSGTQVPIDNLTVRINQVGIICPGAVTAYVSVTDQFGYSVSGLTKTEFTVTEDGGYVGAPTDVFFVSDNNATISSALVLDYSTSVTTEPDKQSAMELGASDFVNQLGPDDEAEIVKFGGSVVEVVQPFTDNNTLLINAINAFWDEGPGTPLFDACKTAADDTAVRSKERKAVIVISDGYEDGSSVGIDNVIDDALSFNVPIFTIGVGDNVATSTLMSLADNTGGQYYSAPNPENIRTVYQQLADVLLYDQYILTYTSGLGTGSTADLTIEANLPPPSTAIKGNHTRSITVCP